METNGKVLERLLEAGYDFVAYPQEDDTIRTYPVIADGLRPICDHDHRVTREALDCAEQHHKANH